MKILQINTCNFGSTGNIMLGISDAAKAHGHEMLVSYPSARSNRKKAVENELIIGDRISRNIHLLLAKFTGYNGMFSYFATKAYLKKVDEYQPDVIHFHNLHNCYINLPLLFAYIKKHHIRVVWTLHDCWSFTGQCPHFVMANCSKWKTGCHHCPQTRQYPVSYVDQTKTMWTFKKKWFTEVENLTIVTPSQWLAGLVKESFLGEYPVRIINNGINLDIFKPRMSTFRETHGLQNKKIILGVAFGWEKRKGLDIFIELSHRLDDNYQIILVGTDEAVDRQLPNGILPIRRTQNQEELSELYSAADVFVNPTREDNYPTVNMEALACGTPVITFKTGGSPEIVDASCGSVIDCEDLDSLTEEIKRVCSSSVFPPAACTNHARFFAYQEKFEQYILLYESLMAKQDLHNAP